MEKKSYLVTQLLCFFLGGFGVHRFYTGYVGLGIAQLLTLGGCGIWVLIDFISICIGKYKDANNQELEGYNKAVGITLLVIFLVLPVILQFIGIIAAMTVPTLMNSTSDSQYKVAVKKSASVLNQSITMNYALNGSAPKYFQNGEELAKYFEKTMNGTISGDTITYNDDMVYKFVVNGDCSNNSCMVLVDCNGLDKGPNQYWKKDKPSDRFVFYLNYVDGTMDGIRPSAEIKDILYGDRKPY